MFFKQKILFAACLAGLFPVFGFATQEESAQAAAEQNKVSWFTADFSLDNSVGIGTFVSGYARAPQWTSSLTISPRAELPLPRAWPQVFAEAELSANIWWLNSIQTSAFDANHRIQFPDLTLAFTAPTIFEIPKAGISFSAGIPIVVPISKLSLAMNRILSIGLGAGVKWKKSQFSVAFLPSARAWLHNGNAKTVACVDSDGAQAIVPGLVNPENPDFEIDQYMLSLSAFRDEETDGQNCSITGRQSLWTLKNSAVASWSGKSHKFSIGLTYYWNFLRALEERPELAGLFSSTQSFTQAVLGKIAYTYVLPFSVDMAVTTGVMSYQSIFSKTGTPLFPFFDFATPNKNQTQLFVEMTASL